MQAYKTTKSSPSTDGRKKEFVYAYQEYTTVVGQIDKKNKTGKCTIQHWVLNNNDQSDDNGMAYRAIQRCSGCSLNDRRVNKESHNCLFNRDRSELICISRISNCRDNPGTKIIKDILETRYHPERQCISEQVPGLIQTHDYDTALIQNTLSDKESIV